MTQINCNANMLLLTTFLVAALSGCGTTMNQQAGIATEAWGEIDGQGVALYTLDNGRIRARISNFGGTVTELHVPDRDGNFADIVLGFDSLDGYVSRSPYFGCMVGRVGNRIAGGSFELNGEVYDLPKNNGPHHLHGGERGFDKVVWTSDAEMTPDGPELHLQYRSPDGEQGYPGTLDVHVIYTLTYDDELRIVMTARADRATPVNIVHHSYWNLAGHQSGDVLGQNLQLAAERYTPADATLIPTGALDPVAGTPFDFRVSRAIGSEIAALPPRGEDPGGYDVNYVVDGDFGVLRAAARAVDPESGRVLEVYSDAPGIQFYSGNFLDGITGKGGAVYQKHAGFCLESQIFPDAVHQQGTPGWPTVILQPGSVYRHVMVHRFRTEDSQ